MPALIIFIKNPEKGKVKSRLAKDIGEDAALRIYELMLEYTRSLTREFAAEKFVFYSDYPNWNDAWDVNTYRKRLQQGDGPGERMAAAFEAVFEEGHDRALMIGSDCYELTPGIMGEAINALSAHEVVIGPAHHGGYYLLGMRRGHPELFANVARRPMLILEESGLSHHILPTLHNLDTLEDLTRNGLKYE